MSAELNQETTTSQRRLPRPIKVVIGAGVVIAAAIGFIAAGSSRGTFALWNDSVNLPETTITAAGPSAGLSIELGTAPGPADQSAVSFPASTWANMLPGDVIRAPITVTNLDEDAYQLAASIDGSDPDLKFSLASDNCGTTSAMGTQLTAVPTRLTPAAIAGNASRTFCLQVELSSSMASTKAGTTLAPKFTVSIRGEDN